MNAKTDRCKIIAAGDHAARAAGPRVRGGITRKAGGADESNFSLEILARGLPPPVYYIGSASCTTQAVPPKLRMKFHGCRKLVGISWVCDSQQTFIARQYTTVVVVPVLQFHHHRVFSGRCYCESRHTCEFDWSVASLPLSFVLAGKTGGCRRRNGSSTYLLPRQGRDCQPGWKPRSVSGTNSPLTIANPVRGTGSVGSFFGVLLGISRRSIYIHTCILEHY